MIHLYSELHRFVPALASAIGVRVAEIEVNHHSRQHGKSKYNAGRLVRGILDLMALKLLPRVKAQVSAHLRDPQVKGLVAPLEPRLSPNQLHQPGGASARCGEQEDVGLPVRPVDIGQRLQQVPCDISKHWTHLESAF